MEKQCRKENVGVRGPLSREASYAGIVWIREANYVKRA